MTEDAEVETAVLPIKDVLAPLPLGKRAPAPLDAAP